MSIKTIPCPYCGGSGKLTTKAAGDLIPGDVLLPTEPGEEPMTIHAVTGEGEGRLILTCEDDEGNIVYYHGVPRTRQLPVARKIPALPGEGA